MQVFKWLQNFRELQQTDILRISFNPTRIHTYTYIYIHILTYTYIYIHIHTYTYTYLHILTYTYIYLHILTYQNIKSQCILPIQKAKFKVSSVGPSSERNVSCFEGPTLKTLNFAFYISSIPTFLYFDLYLNTAYAAHYVYFIHTYRFNRHIRYSKTMIR